jgi:tetratricopeptide (TPR) repeat protein
MTRTSRSLAISDVLRRLRRLLKDRRFDDGFRLALDTLAQLTDAGQAAGMEAVIDLISPTLRSASRKRERGWIQNYASIAALLRGDLHDARKHLDRALEAADSLDDIELQVAVLTNEGVLRHDEGEIDLAQSSYRRLQSLHRWVEGLDHFASGARARRFGDGDLVTRHDRP